MKTRTRARRWISALWALCLVLSQPVPLLAGDHPTPSQGNQTPRLAWESLSDGGEIAAVTAGPPTALDIAGPGTMEVGETAVFTATASATVKPTVPMTFTWELAGRHPYVVSGNSLRSTHSVSFGVAGTGYITVTAENVEGSVTWVRRIYVQEPPQPDLVARDLTYNGTSVTYYIRNYGDATVTETHTSRLYVDNVHVDTDTISVPIAPGQTLKRLFSHVPFCSGQSDEVKFYVDYDDLVDESNEANNRRVETVLCDDSPPVITRGPEAFDIAQTSAQIRWWTDEASDSLVVYGTRRGAFNLSATNTATVTQHAVTLKSLRPGVTYEYKVRSTDDAGNTVESRPRTFETLAPPAPAPPAPTVELVRDPDRPGAYQMRASFGDATNVAHVEFFLNGELIGVDYGNRLQPAGTMAQEDVSGAIVPAPQATQPIPTSAFKTTFVPYKQGYTRAGFFDTGHTATAVVHTWDRVTYATPVTVQISSTSEPLRMEAHIEAPAPDHTIYINGDTTPAGTIVQVEVFAARYDWDCEYAAFSTSADCAEVMRAVDYVNVYRGSDFLTTLYPSNDQDFDYATYVDLSGLPAGSHQIRVLAVDAEAGEVWRDTFVTVVQRLPSLALTREVDRFGNRIRVRLTVENLPGASGMAKIMQVEDYVRGFQVAQDHETYDVWADYAAWGDDVGENVITIDFPNSPGDVKMLDPGESLELDYWMVPILYEDDIEYEIGHKQVEVRYMELSGDVRTAAFDREWLNEQWIVSEATHDANYLIVTAPEVLMWTESNTDNVNLLLMTMADLARLRLGVLGYLEEPVSAQDFDALITKGGAWSVRMADEFETVGNGYVLIVGEQEVVPAWTEHGGDVEISDQPYADTGGAGAPDLVVGRIIGNTAYDLRKPIQASNDVYLGDADFDRSKAWLLSGGGEGQREFADQLNEIQAKLYDDPGIAEHTKALAYDYHDIANVMHEVSSGDGFVAGNMLGAAYDHAVLADRTADYFWFFDPNSGTDVYGFDQVYDSDDVLVVGHVTPGPEDDLVMGDRSTGEIRIFSTGADSAFSPGAYGFGPQDLLAVGDVDGDGVGEIIHGFVGIYAEGVAVYDAAGAEKSGYGFTFDFALSDGLAAGDLDGSAGAEIVIGDAGTNIDGAIKVFSADGTLLASKGGTFFSNSYQQLAVGNVALPAGSAAEIVVKHPGWIWVYDLNTAKGTLDEVERMYLPWMSVEDRMALADINGDGVDEILIARPDDDLITQVDIYHCERVQPDVNAWTPESDILVYRGHGSPGSLDCVRSFPSGFGNARPFIFAATCDAGNYEESSDNGVAEAFFDAHGAVYIGSTAPSNRQLNLNAVKGFLSRWGDYDSIAESFMDLERDKWGTDAYWRKWIREYNYYGDVKFGAFPQPGMASVSEVTAAPTETLTLDLPALAVTTTNGIDRVTIPGGDLWLEVDEAQVPIWLATYEYPAGVRVQEIVMDDRSGLETHTGWVLPLNTDATDYDLPDIAATLTVTDDVWVPATDVPFAWTTMDNPDGTTTLSLAVYPFYYHALTTESEYYRHHSFTITTTTTALTITHLSPSQHVYEPGDWVDVDLQIENGDAALDVVVQGDIVADDGTVVSGLLLRSLHDLTGPIVFDPSWDSTGTPAGDYRIVVTLQDSEGAVLDQAEAGFRLGLVQGELTSLTVDPGSLAAGPMFDIGLGFRNTGSMPITGTAQVTVLPASGGGTTAIMTGTLAVRPGGTATFSTLWDATGIASGDYVVHGVVKYDGRATSALIFKLKSSFQNYLPLILRR
ncbi:MAG: hypothetical protein JXC32_00515 [Anaerolineae bacterium]|nr:hypothetical protein [Anaerolineae bacterium]